MSAALPAAADDLEICGKQSEEIAIIACTRGIQSGDYSGDRLADLYIGRGTAHLKKGDYDLAMADYDEAIKINSKYQRSYRSRGDAYRQKGDRDRAIADYDEWLRLAADRANALQVRGERYTSFG